LALLPGEIGGKEAGCPMIGCDCDAGRYGLAGGAVPEAVKSNERTCYGALVPHRLRSPTAGLEVVSDPAEPTEQ
jgi:hypothetical protein